MGREVVNFSSFWRATTFSRRSSRRSTCSRSASASARSSSTRRRLDYVEFVGTGMVATAVIFSSALPAMFGTFVKYRFQRTYDAILAAPVDVEELVTAEMLWIALRAGLRLRPAARRDAASASTRAGGCCSCRSSASSPARLGLLRHRDRRRPRSDRPVQLRDHARDHAAVPGRRHVLPDRPAARVGAGARPVQPALPLRRARPRTPSSASRAGSTSGTSPSSSSSASRCGAWRSTR